MPTLTKPSLRHEDFCPAVVGTGEPRVESFVALRDDERMNRSVPVLNVTRCVECGVASYSPIGA